MRQLRPFSTPTLSYAHPAGARSVATLPEEWHPAVVWSLILPGAWRAAHCSFLLPTTLQEPLHPPFDRASFRPALEREGPARQFLDRAPEAVPERVPALELALSVAPKTPGPAFYLLLDLGERDGFCNSHAPTGAP